MRYERLLNDFPVLDFGRQFDRRNESGVVREPPAVVHGLHYVVLVPKVDADGNEIAGILDDAPGPAGHLHGVEPPSRRIR